MLPYSDIARLLLGFESSLQCHLETAQGYPYVTFTPQILPFLDPCGFSFLIYFRLFTHQTEQILLLCWLHSCFNFLAFTICHLKREISSKPLCLIGLWVPQESQDPWAHKVSESCAGAPSLGSPLDQRVVPVFWGVSHSQSTTESPVQVFSVLSLTAGTAGALGGLTLNPLWSNTINIIENYNSLRLLVVASVQKTHHVNQL